MKIDFMFSSESVTRGHPDKLCDQISDAIVDRFLARDPYSRINAECAVAKGVAFVATIFSSAATVDISETTREVIAEAGYREGEFNASTCSVLTSTTELPPETRLSGDIAEMDDDALDRLTVRNQVTQFGFACRQTPAMMPLPVALAHRLCRRLGELGDGSAGLPLTPDAAAQVGVEYRDRRPKRIHSINLVVAQHRAEAISVKALREALVEEVVEPVLAEEPVRPDRRTRVFISPEGPRVDVGVAVHSGLTGRKTGVDTYGEYARHSESAMSGKDPLRIDRVAAYAARHAAKNVVAAGLAEECEVTLSYSIGLPGPVSIQVETFGTGALDEAEIAQRLARHFDFRLGAIVRDYDLLNASDPARGPTFRRLAAYGQVGRTDVELAWEQVDLAEQLRDG